MLHSYCFTYSKLRSKFSLARKLSFNFLCNILLPVRIHFEACLNAKCWVGSEAGGLSDGENRLERTQIKRSSDHPLLRKGPEEDKKLKKLLHVFIYNMVAVGGRT